jgi:hypothetical protein
MNKEELKKYGEETRRKNFKSSLINFSIGLLLVIFLYIGYLFYSGDINYIGKETHSICAEITKQKRYHWGKGKFKYRVTYVFYINDKKYSDSYRAWRQNSVGDCVRIEYIIKNPNQSRIK